jgi:Ca2+-binding RTX toxin-like protein
MTPVTTTRGTAQLGSAKREQTMANIKGTLGNDTLYGTQLDDHFFASYGDDTMYGDDGNDTFHHSAGNDIMIGGRGSDTVDYSRADKSMYIDLSAGYGSGMTNDETDTYSSIENVIGSNFFDVIGGDGNANHIRGMGGDDWIGGGGGADVLEGGEGNDLLFYIDSTARVVVDLLNNTASGGSASGDTISGFEGVWGSNYNDILSGTHGDNGIIGAAGNDTINGRGGDDDITGGEGNDIMTGGTGADTFWFEEGTNTGIDRITDFNVYNDKIVFLTDFDGTVDYSFTYDVFSNTYDVTVDFGNAGAVILEDLSSTAVGLVDEAVELW